MCIGSGRVLVGDCLHRLKELPDGSIDSIVTDPPYEIGFMGKAWDGTGIAYNVELWRECLRVLKPGGHLLSFGATRSYHRMAVAIEDAGFEIRDSIHWTYGSGFPKSLDVSKAINKMSGVEFEAKPASGVGFMNSSDDGYNTTLNQLVQTGESTDEAQQWQGWGTALKPSHEPIVVARKPLVGTVASNVLAFGTGALNIDASRVGRASGDVSRDGFGNGGIGISETGQGGDAGKGAEWVTSSAGRWPANTILTHSARCKPTGETVVDDITLNGDGNDLHFHGHFNGGHDKSPKAAITPIFACVAGCPLLAIDQQSGPAGAAAPASGPSYSGPSKSGGGASRFFTTTEWSDEWDEVPFIYQAKPGKKERNAGLTGMPEVIITGRDEGQDAMAVPHKTRSNPSANFHPTVKPVALMRHLVKLVTPPGGVVLDPFLGSGTTAVAAELDNYGWIGCELTDDYLPIIQGRVTNATKKAPTLFDDDADDK